MTNIDRQQVSIIFVYSLLTALACGLGSVPFFFLKNISEKGIGIAKSIALGLMIAASFGMIDEGLNAVASEGLSLAKLGVFGGMVLGMVIILYAKKLFHKYEDTITFGETSGKTASQLLMFLAIMTIHSGTEGIAMGFAFGPSWKLGLLVALVMGIQNIPEGLAIGAMMVPKGISPWKAVGRSIVSSLPQPIVAVPAFLFVSLFKPLLPWGLGFAAGAMIWMSISELLPEALETVEPETVATVATCSMMAMVILEQLL